MPIKNGQTIGKEARHRQSEKGTFRKEETNFSRGPILGGREGKVANGEPPFPFPDPKLNGGALLKAHFKLISKSPMHQRGKGLREKQTK